MEKFLFISFAYINFLIFYYFFLTLCWRWGILNSQRIWKKQLWMQIFADEFAYCCTVFYHLAFWFCRLREEILKKKFFYLHKFCIQTITIMKRSFEQYAFFNILNSYVALLLFWMEKSCKSTSSFTNQGFLVLMHFKNGFAGCVNPSFPYILLNFV